MSEAEDNTNAARSLSDRLTEAQSKVHRVGLDGTNDHQRFKFASIHAIADVARQALAAEGLALVPTGAEVLADDEITTGKSGFRVVLRQSWLLIAGSESVALQSVGEAIDYGDKAHNKASTFARKNLLIALLNLSTGDDDPDAHSPEAGARKPTATRKPAQEPPPVKPEPNVESGGARLARLLTIGRNAGVDEKTIADIARTAVADAAKAAGMDPEGFAWPDVLIVADAFRAANAAVAERIRTAETGASDPYS